jgi:phosphatidylserine decarboxylase
MLHKEGKATIFITLVGLFAINALLQFMLPEQTIVHNIGIIISLAFLVIILQFFRNPAITPTKGDNRWKSSSY